MRFDVTVDIPKDVLIERLLYEISDDLISEEAEIRGILNVYKESLSDYDNDELIDHLKTRGYMVNEGIDKLIDKLYDAYITMQTQQSPYSEIEFNRVLNSIFMQCLGKEI